MHDRDKFQLGYLSILILLKIAYNATISIDSSFFKPATMKKERKYLHFDISSIVLCFELAEFDFYVLAERLLWCEWLRTQMVCISLYANGGMCGFWRQMNEFACCRMQLIPHENYGLRNCHLLCEFVQRVRKYSNIWPFFSRIRNWTESVFNKLMYFLIFFICKWIKHSKEKRISRLNIIYYSFDKICPS